MSSTALLFSRLGQNKNFWIATALILWLYFAISHIPAIWGAFFMTKAGNLAMTGVNGTIWSGSASLVSVKVKQIDYSVGQLSWKLEPLSLLTLKPCAKVNTQMDNQQFDGRVCVGGKGAITVSDATASFPAGLLKDQLPIQIDGQISLSINQLSMQANRLEKLNAKLGWMGAKIFNGSNWMVLGGFGADLTDDGKAGLKAHVVDVNSPVHIDAALMLVAPAGGNLKGTMTMSETFVRENNASAWLSLFAVQGAPDAQGNIPFTLDMNL